MYFPVFKNVIQSEMIVCIGEAVVVGTERLVPAIVIRRMARDLQVPQLTFVAIEYIMYLYTAVQDREIDMTALFGIFANASDEEISCCIEGDFMKSYIKRLMEVYMQDTIATMPTTVAAIHYLKHFQCPTFDTMLQELLTAEAERRFLHASAKRIQIHFRQAIADPNTPLCRSRLMHEWQDMVAI